MRGMLRLSRRLRQRHYALALAAHKSWRTGAMLLLAGIPRRIGFASAPAAGLYTERVVRPLALHDCDRLLQLLRPFGDLEATPRPSLSVDEDTQRQARALLAPARATGRPLAGICPGSVWRTKRWPASAYAELVRRLETAGYACVLLGSPAERDLTRMVYDGADGQGLDLGGATDLTVLAAVLAEMSVVVSNDSAPMHLATAVGVPQVAVFCATVPAQGYGPRSEHAPNRTEGSRVSAVWTPWGRAVPARHGRLHGTRSGRGRRGGSRACARAGRLIRGRAHARGRGHTGGCGCRSGGFGRECGGSPHLRAAASGMYRADTTRSGGAFGGPWAIASIAARRLRTVCPTGRIAVLDAGGVGLRRIAERTSRARRA